MFIDRRTHSPEMVDAITMNKERCCTSGAKRSTKMGRILVVLDHAQEDVTETRKRVPSSATNDNHDRRYRVLWEVLYITEKIFLMIEYHLIIEKYQDEHRCCACAPVVGLSLLVRDSGSCLEERRF